METSEFARPSLETAREHLRLLFAAFADATGYPPTLVGLIARGEPKWARQFEERDFTHTSYDTAVSRLSALWPDGVEWPAAVPRQAPGEIPEEIQKKLAARAARKGGSLPKEEIKLPGNADWPADIPRPETEGGPDGQEA